LDQNTVFNLAYFNYAKANKLKVKASMKIKKLLARMDGNNSRKVNSSKINKLINPQIKMMTTIHLTSQRRNVQNAGNGDTTPQRSVRQRTMMIRSPDQRS
jgi:hypothetical protein